MKRYKHLSALLKALREGRFALPGGAELAITVRGGSITSWEVIA